MKYKIRVVSMWTDLDNIRILQEIIENQTVRNLLTHLLFVDLHKAYDTVFLNNLLKH